MGELLDGVAVTWAALLSPAAVPAGSTIFTTMVIESPWAIGPVSGVPSASVSASGVLPSAWYRLVDQAELTLRSKVSAPNSPVLRTV